MPELLKKDWPSYRYPISTGRATLPGSREFWKFVDKNVILFQLSAPLTAACIVVWIELYAPTTLGIQHFIEGPHVNSLIDKKAMKDLHEFLDAARSEFNRNHVRVMRDATSWIIKGILCRIPKDKLEGNRSWYVIEKLKKALNEHGCVLSSSHFTPQMVRELIKERLSITTPIDLH